MAHTATPGIRVPPNGFPAHPLSTLSAQGLIPSREGYFCDHVYQDDWLGVDFALDLWELHRIVKRLWSSLILPARLQKTIKWSARSLQKECEELGMVRTWRPARVKFPPQFVHMIYKPRRCRPEDCSCWQGVDI